MSTPNRRSNRNNPATSRLDIAQPTITSDDEIIQIDNPQPDVNIRSNYNIVALKITDEFHMDFIEHLPKSMIKNIKTLAKKHAITHCRITNLENQLTELRTHATNRTTPEFIIKQYKNILTKPEETTLKAALLVNKIEQITHQRQIQLIDCITIFNGRHTDVSNATQFGRQLLTSSPDFLNPTHINQALPSILDYYIIHQLCEFETKQTIDKEKKDIKRRKLEEHRANNVPTMATSIDIQRINKQLKNLKIKTKTIRNKPPKATNLKKAYKKDNNNKKVHFQQRKQKKSQAVSNKRRKRRNQNGTPRRNGN
jgi:hypothetical protein